MSTEAASAARHATPLPPEWTTFVGRARELAELERLLSDARLLTVTGAGGSGKTRLVRELVARGLPGVPAFAWVELAPLEDPSLVAAQTALAFGIAEDVRSAAALADLLRSREALVVLDNCEHLVDACAELAHTLLAECPGLRILATSREALGVKGERAWLLQPLPVPADDAALAAIQSSDAVRLFVERARDAAPTFELTEANAAAVSELCRRLDGIPLALELAAARVRALAPTQIRDRLDDAFRVLAPGARTAIPRHRTLAAAIDWSHELLRPSYRSLFRRLAVFRGGFTLDAAEEVCAGAGIEPALVLDHVAALVDRSLLVFREEEGAARYGMLETVRQYAARRLAESGEQDAVRARHAAYVQAVVERLEPDFTTPRRRAALDALLPEMDNIREALLSTREQDPAAHVRLVNSLWWFWYSTRHWREAGRWIREALELPAAQAPGRERARLLFASGALAALQAQGEAARAALRESAALAEAAGDPALEAYALNYLGLALIQEGRIEAEEHNRRAAAWFREQGDDYGLRLALLLLALAAQAGGRREEAVRLNEEAVAVARRYGADRELAISLQNLSLLRLMQGDVDLVEPLVLESLAALRRDPSYVFAASSLDSLAEVWLTKGRLLDAARLLGAAEAAREAIGAQAFPVVRARLDPLIAAARAGPRRDDFERCREAGRTLTLEQVLDEIVEGAAPPPAPGPAPTSAAGSDTASELAAGPGLPAGPEPGVKPEPASPDLRIEALGPLRVQVAGRVLEPAAWAYAKPRELLVHLALHPKGRTREEIGRAIWPGASPPQVKNSFHVTLHHLRRTLGDAGWIVIEGDRYRLAPGLRCELDAERFELEARRVLREDDPGVPRLEEVRALYQGDFLEGEVVGAWHEEHADRLRRLWVDVNLRLAAALEARGDDAAAAVVYRETAVREELNEVAHRGVMRTWSRLGDRPRALRHYQRLLALLRDELDTEPEPETVALYDSIRAAVPV